jgi:hypothetical protein
MKSRVSGVKVVTNFAEKESGCVLACRAYGRRGSGKRGTGGQMAGHFVDVAIHDLSNEINKNGIDL